MISLDLPAQEELVDEKRQKRQKKVLLLLLTNRCMASLRKSKMWA